MLTSAFFGVRFVGPFQENPNKKFLKLNSMKFLACLQRYSLWNPLQSIIYILIIAFLICIKFYLFMFFIHCISHPLHLSSAAFSFIIISSFVFSSTVSAINSTLVRRSPGEIQGPQLLTNQNRPFMESSPIPRCPNQTTILFQ
jgi:hypothetical protein